MEAVRWLRVFRALGAQAQRAARPLAGTAAGRRSLGRGASGDPTVVLDKRLEDLVLSAARRAGDVRLLSEELGERDFGSPRATLIVDPLDGSTNATAGLGLYAVSYALAPPDPTLGNVSLGYIRNLVSGEEYWAARGRGAFRNGRRMRSQRGPSLGVVLVEMSPRPLRAADAARPVLERAGKVRCLGSMALDLCYVASGAASAVLDVRGGLGRPLDSSAGKLILEEAGGTMTDAEGRSLDALKIDLLGRMDSIASANGAVHARVLALLDGGGRTFGE
ncbi:MAG: D-fructose 1,6-bisphosphatase [Euryarchaeota archaeon]|nr:D-fructose 1,6-bisphosphatase [Euryarchaeota archaeon]